MDNGESPAAGARDARIVLLGTGTPHADPERSGPAVALVAGGRAYVFDCGPGIVRRAAGAARIGIAALEPQALSRVFLTHLHSDHTTGLPDAILAPWVLGRSSPLQVWGPPGTREMVAHLLAAYERDIHVRRTGLEPANETGWQVAAKEIVTGTVHEDDAVRIEAFPVRHGDWPAFGYRLVTPERVIVISGDTAPTEEIVTASLGCDVLVHEVYSVTGFAAHTPAWQAYHASMHTSSHELAAIATRARPGLLVLYHQLFWGTPAEDLLLEVRARYAGGVVSARDLDVI